MKNQERCGLGAQQNSASRVVAGVAYTQALY